MGFFEKFRTAFDLSYAVRTFMASDTKVVTVNNVSDFSALYNGMTSVLAACHEYGVPCDDVRQIYLAFFDGCNYLEKKGSDLKGVGPGLLRTMEEIYTAYSYNRSLPGINNLVLALADHVAMHNSSHSDSNLINAVTNTVTDTVAPVRPEQADSTTTTTDDRGYKGSRIPCFYHLFGKCTRRKCSFSHALEPISSLNKDTEENVIKRAASFLPRPGPRTGPIHTWSLNEERAKAIGLSMENFSSFSNAQKTPDNTVAATATDNAPDGNSDVVSDISDVFSSISSSSSSTPSSLKTSDICTQLDGSGMTYEDIAAVLTDPDLTDLTDTEMRRLEAHKEKSETLYCSYVKRLYVSKYSS
jgi:hypothetical protein